MASLNNILSLRINQVSAAGGINVGNTVTIARQSDLKSCGSSIPVGDFSNNIDLEGNIYFDPDLYDQGNL